VSTCQGLFSVEGDGLRFAVLVSAGCGKRGAGGGPPVDHVAVQVEVASECLGVPPRHVRGPVPRSMPDNLGQVPPLGV
jgi:hypothetical protein